MRQLAKNILTRIFIGQMKRIIAVHQPKIIAVVGSVGKTSTKFAIAKVLSDQFRVRVQAGNYNAPISVPFIFLGRTLPNLYNPFGWFKAWLDGQKIIHGEFDYDVVVVELGTDQPGDIAAFESVLQPTITVVSAISEEHMEFFADVDAVAAEELAIAKFCQTLVINIDDIAPEYINKYIPNNATVHSYGFNHSDYKIYAKRNHHHQFTVSIGLAGKSTVTTEVSMAATHSLKTVAAAAAVADLLGMPIDAIKRGIALITPAPGRMQLLSGIKDSLIIDDTYNSSPLAASAAIKTLYEMQAPQHIAVLGMMNELGQHSKQAHQQIGKLCDPNQLDLVITIGTDANSFLADAAEQNGCKVLRADSPYHAAKLVSDHLQPSAIILVKGSQNGVFAEETVKLLLSDSDDKERLVRQNKFWLDKKRSQFK